MEDVVETAKDRLHRERRQDQPRDAAHDIGAGRAEKPLHEISADKAAIGEAEHDDQKRCRLDLSSTTAMIEAGPAIKGIASGNTAILP